MQHLKQLITTLVALFAMTTGAWADGTLLTTITASSDFTSGSKTFDNVATVTFDEEVSYTDYAGWYAGGSPISVTVAPVDGVTITSVKFFIGDNSPEDTQAPFTATLHIEYGMATQTQVNDTNYDGGLKKIEVYGTAGTALTKDKNDATGRTWILDKMLAGNVELQVEYEPEFTATFVAKNGNTIESGKATVSVKEGEAAAVAAKLEGNALKGLYEGQTVTLTAKQGYKFRDVSVKKGAKAPTTAQLNVPTGWNGDNTKVTANDLPGFVALTDEEAQAIVCPDAEGNVYVIHDIPSDGYIKIIAFNNGEKQAQQSFTLGRDYNGLYDDAYNWDVKYYYTTGK